MSQIKMNLNQRSKWQMHIAHTNTNGSYPTVCDLPKLHFDRPTKILSRKIGHELLLRVVTGTVYAKQLSGINQNDK